MKRSILAFIVGFFSCILVIILSSFIFYTTIIKTQNSLLKDELTIERKTSNFEVSTFNILKPDFFVDINNDLKFDLNEIEEEVIFINFWATWCEPCIAEMPYFEEFVKNNKKSNIKFLFVSDESVNTIKKFQENNKFQLPIFKIDTLKNSFINHTSIPTNYIIHKDKQMVFKVSGSANWNNTLYQNLLNVIVK